MLAELTRAAALPAWREANAFISPPETRVGVDYLLNWNLDGLAAKKTSDGHSLILPLSNRENLEDHQLPLSRRPAGAFPGVAALSGATALRVLGSCSFEPAAPQSMARVSGAPCGLCEAMSSVLGFWWTKYPAIGIALIVTVCALLCFCARLVLRRCPEQRRGPAHAQPLLAQPLLASGTQPAIAAGGAAQYPGGLPSAREYRSNYPDAQAQDER